MADPPFAYIVYASLLYLRFSQNQLSLYIANLLSIPTEAHDYLNAQVVPFSLAPHFRSHIALLSFATDFTLVLASPTMAMKPEDIVAQLNRENERLQIHLAREKREKAMFQSKLDVIRREKGVVQQCVEHDKRNTAIAKQQNEVLKQEVLEGRWDIDAVHRRNERLCGEVDMLQHQLIELQNQHCHAVLQAEHAWGEVRNRDQYIHGMHRYVAFVENYSNEGKAASHAAFQNMETFSQSQLHLASLESQCLQDNLAKLQRFIDKITNEDKFEQKALMDQLVTAKAEVLVAQQRQNVLEYKLSKSNEEIEAIQRTSTSLVNARNLLRKKLVKNQKTNANLKQTEAMAKEAAKKAALEATRATAAAEKQMLNEITRLEEKIEEQKAEVQVQQVLQNDLKNSISAEQQRQREFEISLKAAESKASRYKELNENLKSRIKSMKTGGSTLTQTIRNQEIIIQQLRDREKKLEAEAAKERRIASQYQKELWRQKETNDVLAQVNSQLRGYNLGNTHTMLEELGRNRSYLNVRILKNVLRRLSEYNTLSAGIAAMDNIRGFLLSAREAINDYMNLIVQDVKAIDGLIHNIKEMTPAIAYKEEDNSLLVKFAQGLQDLKGEVRLALEFSEADVVSRGDGENGRMRRILEPLELPGLLTGCIDPYPTAEEVNHELLQIVARRFALSSPSF
ncbi:hypothetical protein F4678DRAFT_223068 [Xylaria arbuscula]|nr:hypothetical protein F4678DRAFT_223068 [Xylaria arbuscula]